MLGMIKKAYNAVKNSIVKVADSGKAFGLALVGFAIANGVPANAAGVLTAPTFALDDVGTVAGALLVGLAGFWAIRKGLSLAR